WLHALRCRIYPGSLCQGVGLLMQTLRAASPHQHVVSHDDGTPLAHSAARCTGLKEPAATTPLSQASDCCCLRRAERGLTLLSEGPHMALFRKLMNGGDTQQVAVAEDLDTQIGRAQDERRELEALITIAQAHVAQIPQVNATMEATEHRAADISQRLDN